MVLTRNLSNQLKTPSEIADKEQNASLSSWNKILLGVPQEDVLGPILFNLQS